MNTVLLLFEISLVTNYNYKLHLICQFVTLSTVRLERYARGAPCNNSEWRGE